MWKTLFCVCGQASAFRVVTILAEHNSGGEMAVLGWALHGSIQGPISYRSLVNLTRLQASYKLVTTGIQTSQVFSHLGIDLMKTT
jgi:hypothetical protein